ncbi:addiction module antidote protein [Methylobacterium sp. Leaf100]|uniref:addiction module antidote protein n=1 Tax=Methylobacterium sp. Leaf100 TaxID=1736252 RepID=UPI0006FBBDDA|nr:addiction module antidote protein [Methylobacterium sp. Leaf100]KQP36605.1 hypothetical protein ASF25_01190 [Methylobacterium sp. Leaf100]
MPLATFPYDTAEHLKTEEDIAFYIEAVLEDGDPALVRDTIGVVARARAMTQVARELGLPRETLFEMIADEGKPGAETVAKVLKALGRQPTTDPAVAPA